MSLETEYNQIRERGVALIRKRRIEGSLTAEEQQQLQQTYVLAAAVQLLIMERDEAAALATTINVLQRIAAQSRAKGGEDNRQS